MAEEQQEHEDVKSEGVGADDVESDSGDRERSRPVNVCPYKPKVPSPWIERLAEALALGKTQREAAAHAGVSPRTAHRWQHDPDFLANVTRLRCDAFDQVAGQVTAAGTEAMDTIRELLRTADTDATRLRAGTDHVVVGSGSPRSQCD